jgi:two-component system LytT family response regulator
MSQNINCIIVDDESMAREILEIHLNKIELINIIGSYKNVTEAFNAISTHDVDLIFLDINMPEISGLSFAKTINKGIKVIFTTAYREYAIDGFDLKAVDYLLKPISYDRILQAVNKYLDENKKSIMSSQDKTVSNNKFLFVRSDRKMIKINFQEMNYIESFSDYIKIHLADKTIITRETISSIEEKLPKESFIRIHRSYIISFDIIQSFTNEFIEVNSKPIPISRSYKKEVLRRLENV